MATWSRVARRIRVPLSFAFAIAYVWLAHPTRSSLLAGGLLLLPGLMLRGLASGHVQKDEQLTTSGPYAYTRNPLYLGSIIMAAGFAVAARNLVDSGDPARDVCRDLCSRRSPEKNATCDRHFQTTTTTPATCRVSRCALRATAISEATFSSERYWKHREYQAVLGCVAVLARARR